LATLPIVISQCRRLFLVKNVVVAIGSAVICFSAVVSAFPQSAPPQAVSTARKPGRLVRIELIGDSTQTDNAGYGRGFCANLTEQIECLNSAKGGSSTKTFRRDGIWEKALESKPDYVLIQFGHNDMVSGEPNDRQVPLAEYEQNLRTFVMQARAIHATPVLITPLTRRYFGADGKIHSDLTAYADGMKQVAEDLHAPLIDLQAQSIAYLNSIGEKAGSQLGITKKNKDGSVGWDKTHLNWQGSYIFGRLVAEGLGKAEPKLSQYVRATPATLPFEGQLAMQVLRKEPFKVLVVGDSGAASAGGWAPGFCATVTKNVTCLGAGLAGESIANYTESGHWSHALAEKAQYYVIEFGDDETTARTEQFRHTLAQMVADVRRIGAIPILVSPLAISDDGQLRTFADSVRDIAAEQRVTYMDLYGTSHRYLGSLPNVERAKMLTGDAKAPLTAFGAAVTGRLIADNLIRSEVELGPDVNGLPEGAGPATPMQAAPTDGH
jgi:lysophospholipase L1-like esterase